MQDKVSAESQYRPITGYAATPVVAAQVWGRQPQGAKAASVTEVGGRSMVILFGLLLVSDGFDGFCLVDQLSDMSDTVASVMGPHYLTMSTGLLISVAGFSLWIGHLARVSRWDRIASCRFRGSLRRWCRIAAFSVTGLACLAGHVLFRTAH